MKNLLVFCVFLLIGIAMGVTKNKINFFLLSDDAVCKRIIKNTKTPTRVDEITILTKASCFETSTGVNLVYDYALNETQEINLKDLNEYEIELFKNTLKIELLKDYCIKDDFKFFKNRDIIIFYNYIFNDNILANIRFNPKQECNH